MSYYIRMRAPLAFFLFTANLCALDGPRYVASSPHSGAFALVENGSAAAVRVDAADWPGVQRAAHDLPRIHAVWEPTRPPRTLDHDGLQCGYCTSGQIMSAIACVEEAHADSVVEIQEFTSALGKSDPLLLI